MMESDYECAVNDAGSPRRCALCRVCKIATPTCLLAERIAQSRADGGAVLMILAFKFSHEWLCA